MDLKNKIYVGCLWFMDREEILMILQQVLRGSKEAVNENGVYC